MKFSTLALAIATLTIASFAHAVDETKFAPQPMSMKSRTDVRPVALGAPVPGELGYSLIDSRQQMDMSKLTRDEVRAMARANDDPAARFLDRVGGM